MTLAVPTGDAALDHRLITWLRIDGARTARRVGNCCALSMEGGHVVSVTMCDEQGEPDYRLSVARALNFARILAEGVR